MCVFVCAPGEREMGVCLAACVSMRTVAALERESLCMSSLCVVKMDCVHMLLRVTVRVVGGDKAGVYSMSDASLAVIVFSLHYTPVTVVNADRQLSNIISVCLSLTHTLLHK